MAIYMWREGPEWTLLDETDFKNSSYSKNGYFSAGGWGGVSYFTNTGYDTTNGRIYATGGHCYAGINLNSSAYNIIGNANKVKIVYDYILVADNTSQYSSGITLILGELAKNSNRGYYYATYQTYSYNPDFSTITNYNTEYSGELVYDLINDTGTMSFTKLSDGTKYNSIISDLSQYWTTSVIFSGSNNAMGGLVKDQGDTSYFGDMHVYYN